MGFCLQGGKASLLNVYCNSLLRPGEAPSDFATAGGLAPIAGIPRPLGSYLAGIAGGAFALASLAIFADTSRELAAMTHIGGGAAGGLGGPTGSGAGRGLGNDLNIEIGVWSIMDIKDGGRHRILKTLHTYAHLTSHKYGKKKALLGKDFKKSAFGPSWVTRTAVDTAECRFMNSSPKTIYNIYIHAIKTI